MSDMVRVGVIGIGNIGTMHARNVYGDKVEGMKLVAVCDISEARRAFCKEEFQGVTIFEDWKELLGSGLVDAVIIAVPHRLHGMIAIEALKADLHVLVEKPLDVTVTVAQELIEVSKKSKGVFAIMLNQRTHPLFCKAREIVQSGALGELKRSVWINTNWYRTQHYYESGSWRATWKGEGGGVLLNQAPHNLDLWQWICGMPVSVRGFCEVAKWHNIEVEDDATLLVKFENGANGVFVISTGEFPGTNRLEIAGDRGKLVLENSVLKWWKLDKPEREFCFTTQGSMPKVTREYEEISFNEKEKGHLGIVQNFANAILHGEELISPGADGIRELNLSNAAYLSEWTGNQEIVFPLDNELFDQLLAQRSEDSHVRDEVAHEDSVNHQARWQVRW